MKVMLKVKSEFTPRGDQPTAIRSLVEGLNDGLRFQTLLGATGTGKSVAWHEPVTLKLEDRYYRGPIGLFIDQVFGSEQQEESLALPPLGHWEVMAWNPETGDSSWQQITGLSRHTSPEKLFRLTSHCGRQVTLTADHSVWVLRDGQVQLLQGDQVRKGDALPVPRRLPEPQEPLTDLNTFELLKDVPGLRVEYKTDVPDSILPVLSVHHKSGQQKLYAMQKRIRGRGISMPVAQALLEADHVSIEDLQFLGSTYTSPTQLKIDAALMVLFGQYVAEGHSAERFSLISTREAEAQNILEQALQSRAVPHFRRKDGDFVVGSSFWHALLKTLMGTHAGNKHLPAQWVGLSNADLAVLLRAYFDGDGGVEKGGVTAVTLSERLAGDLTEALLRFGIWARMRETRKKRPDGTYGTYFKLTISGEDNLKKFQSEVGFLSNRKQMALQGVIKSGNTNVDLVYGVGERLAAERERLGYTQQHLADLAGISRAAVYTFEYGRRNPSRKVFQRLCDALNIQDQAFRGLAEVYWTQIETIEQVVPQTPYVYDFSVEGYETFLTGRGALFVHNTYSVAKVIEETQRSAFILAPNKILTAQLASEFRAFFPDSAVEFFVSYYDYYQPEAYVPGKDLFIEKDAAINQELERLRHSTTRSLLTRPDTIVVASVSAIYGLGDPEEYRKMNIIVKVGEKMGRDEIIDRLLELQYERNDIEIQAGRFRAKGDVIEIWPSYDEAPMRVELWGDEVDRIVMYDPLTGNVAAELPSSVIYPAKHYVSSADNVERAIVTIQQELEERLEYFKSVGKLLEAQRLKERTLYDLEMLKVLGYCSGIENYSRHMDGRLPGETPYTMLDYFPDNFITFIDESHVTVPQIGGMSSGDRSRKQTLVDFGFRLPSAMDNRPLNFEEFLDKTGQVVFVSATPGPYEREVSGNIAEQIIRPTGLVDPRVTLRPIQGQVEDLLGRVRERAAKGERVLVTTLTKRMSEDLTEYLLEKGVRARYMHSDIDTVERQVIIRDLRLGHYDVLVGINLLREGLDLPEVSLVAILDADKPGFLRSERSLIQTIGRAARNVNGEVVLYGDVVTPAMDYAMKETERRREKQVQYNEEHGITPETIRKEVRDVIRGEEEPDLKKAMPETMDRDTILAQITDLELDMWQASEDLDFEKAAALRDQIRELEAKLSGKDFKQPTVPGQKVRRKGRR